MMKIIIVSLLLVSTLAMPTFLGNTCSQKGEKCGHEMEGQSRCCSGLVCNLGSLPGAPGVCGEKACAVEDQVCGHELEGNVSCCSGLTCTVEHEGIIGARGLCKPDIVLEPTCLSQGEPCSHELEASLPCCSGFRCATVDDAPRGAPGLCFPVVIEEKLASEDLCSVEGQICGHELENVQCCTGFVCTNVPDSPRGAPGVCLKNVDMLLAQENLCAVEGEMCGHELQGQVSCCDGFRCTTIPDAPIGAPGVCLKKDEISLQVNENLCAVEGEMCGHELQGQVSCCDGFRCTTVPDAPIGAPGVCLKNDPINLKAKKNLCAIEGEVCGHELANSKCCSGYVCTSVPDSPRGAPGVCMLEASTNFQINENLCAVEGEMCGHELQGQVNCCSGFKCTTVPDSPIGAPGVCWKNVDIKLDVVESLCSVEGQSCGHELEGTINCCSGYTCSPVPDSPLGAPGVCSKVAIIEAIENKNLCAAEGETCGHEREGQKNCCQGFVCYLGDLAPLGSTGICMSQISL